MRATQALALAPLCILPLIAGCGGTVLNGTVSSTTNPLVAQYTLRVGEGGMATVQFGKTTSYGFKTSAKPIPPGGGEVTLLVAGMQANTTYHMQAQVTDSEGRVRTDSDHTFQTGSYPSAVLPSLTVTTSPGQTPQPGIQIINPIESAVQIAATDLAGNLIWAYYDPSIDPEVSTWLAPKQLENGDFIAMAAPTSTNVLFGPTPPSAANLVREFDLAGNTVKQITMAQLNASLTRSGYNLTLQLFSHDITVLPNGHWLILANTFRNVVLNGQTAPTQVLGDVIVDLDKNLNPVWVWNEFDHMDVNRHPWSFPDWTHTNAVIYSPDDGNLLVSIRHQNWIVKVDYNDGNGSGDILWHLGAGGDFKLVGGVDPTDWSYAQHGISFTTQNTSGNFGLAVLDNGDDRLHPGDNPDMAFTCGQYAELPCYSTATVFDIDEASKTATLQFHQILPGNLYAFFGGNALTLENGDVQYDLCGLTPMSSQTMEVTNDPNPQTVWNLTLNNNYAYRTYRLPSLYPGVQW